MFKILIIDLDELNERLRTECMGQAGSCRHCGSHLSVVSSMGPDRWCVFYTSSLAIFWRAVINWIQIWQIWRPQLKWDQLYYYIMSYFLWQLSGSTCAMSIFQVSQGSVETLFRWGGERLDDFQANLFRKLCTKFRQNRLSFVEDITKKTFWSLFSGHCVYSYRIAIWLCCCVCVKLQCCWHVWVQRCTHDSIQLLSVLSSRRRWQTRRRPRGR